VSIEPVNATFSPSAIISRIVRQIPPADFDCEGLRTGFHGALCRAGAGSVYLFRLHQKDITLKQVYSARHVAIVMLSKNYKSALGQTPVIARLLTSELVDICCLVAQ